MLRNENIKIRSRKHLKRQKNGLNTYFTAGTEIITASVVREANLLSVMVINR